MKPFNSTFVRILFRATCLAALALASPDAFALKYSSGGAVVQYQGPLDAGDVNQILLRIELNVINGGGTPPTMNAMGFDFKSGGNVSALTLYTTDQDPVFNTSKPLGTFNNPTNGTYLFNGNTEIDNVGGLHYYWLTVDMKATITPGVKVDAVYNAAISAYITGPPTVADPNPWGFKLTGRTYNIGNGEHYLNVDTVARAMRQFIYDGTAPIFMELTANYPANAEVDSILFQNYLGPAEVIFRPASGQSGKVTQVDPGMTVDFITLKASDKIVFDGRPGGVGTTREWTIRNTNQSVIKGSVIVLEGGSSGNKMEYIIVEGEANVYNGSLISFRTGSGAFGNSNNFMDNCLIRDLTVGGSAEMPGAGVYSSGTAGFPNISNTVTNCHFVDIWKPFTASSAGIYLDANSDAWTLTNNHFYQTVSHSNCDISAAFIIITSGGGYLISGNYMGGQAPNAGGSKYAITSGAGQFAAIVFAAGTGGGANTIESNVISNLSYTTLSTTASAPLFCMTLEGSSDFTIGSSGKGNVIGSSTIANDLVLTNNAGSGSLGFSGINHKATGTASIAYNTFGGITVTGARVNAITHMIENENGITTISNNVIGNANPGNINMLSNSPVFAIDNSSANGVTATGNTIQNFNCDGSMALILIRNSAGDFIFSGNNISGIATQSSSGGIALIQHTGATATINNNSFSDITFEALGVVNDALGIFSLTASPTTISGNTFGSTTPNNIIDKGDHNFYAILHQGAGSFTCENNTIQQVFMQDVGNALFYGIRNDGGDILASKDTVRNITSNATGIATRIFGIYSAGNSVSNLISKCTVENLKIATVSSAGSYATGIWVETGSGTIEKNFISGFTNTSTNTSAALLATWLYSGTWNLFNNVFIVDNGAYTNDISLYGIFNNSSGGSNIYHNTVIIGGASSGAVWSTALRRSSGATGTDIIRNNIFQNLRSGGTGIHHCINSNLVGTMNTDYNYLESADPAKLCYYNAADYNLAGWQGAPVNAANSVSGTTTLDGFGKVLSDPFPGAGTAFDLTATVPDDRVDVTRGVASWMGAYEGPNITTSAISPLTLCAGNAIGVSYTVGGGYVFNGPNTFTAQLSDASGSFAAPVNIGNIASTISGTISATIPGGTPPGTGYRIRVVSDNPVVRGSDNGTDLNIQSGAPAAPVANAASGITCSGFTANWSTAAGAAGYELTVATDAGFTAIVPGYNNLDVGNGTSYGVTGLMAGTGYYYRLRSKNGCGISAVSGPIGPVTTTGAQGVYTVTSTVNGTTVDGVSLRWAITQANSNCGHDIINFNLGAGGPYTINITAPLPDLSDMAGVTIDGWDNAGNDGTPNTIPVFNTSAGTPLDPVYQIILGNGGTVATGLALTGDYNIVKGLVLQDFGDGAVSSNDIAITIAGNNNKVLGCNIGMNAGGTTKGAKTNIGIGITGANNVIGDGTAAGANLISGMNGGGFSIYINQTTATGNAVKGNMIGLQKDGTTLVAGASQNTGIFINISASNNMIGGSTNGEGNVISGMSGGSNRGINIANSATGNKILGNIIGPRADGINYVTSNTQQTGIYISSFGNVIGGGTATERNIISANENNGIYIAGASSTGNVVKGNYVGIDKTGTTFITGSSQDYGVYLTSSAASNTIGGGGIGEGNVISGNSDGSLSGRGIYTNSSAVAGNTVTGNIIGPQSDGLSYLAANTQFYGIGVDNSPNNTIGGITAGERNVVSANESYGVFITGLGSTGNTIKGNYIGIDKNGTNNITGSFQESGVYITSGANSNTVGGSGATEGNVISGNGSYGLVFISMAASNTAMGNIIGPQADGVTYLTPNTQYKGIAINDSQNNIIGGNTAGARNIISANETYGIWINGDGVGSTGNTIIGNYIGPSSSLAGITGSSQDYGIYINNISSGNTIGSTTAGEDNQIVYNTVNGLYLVNTTTSGNEISGNPIYNNTGKPIELNYGPSQANGGMAVPVITTANLTTVSGTSGAFDNIEVFKNTTANCLDASTYVGSAAADGSGNWSLAVALSGGDYVLATATDGSNNTSEFSACVQAGSNRYWITLVGGDWSNPANWSSASGGAGGASIPTAADDAYFDSNSLTGHGTVTMNGGTWYCNTLQMLDIDKTPVFTGTGVLIIGNP